MGNFLLLRSPTAPLGNQSGGGGGATLVFNFPSGFVGAVPSPIAVGGSGGGAALNGSAISMLPSGGHNVGGAGYNTKLNIQSFTTQFTFVTGNSGVDPTNLGFTFCVQNTTSTTNPPSFGPAASCDANMAGYGAFNSTGQYPMANSVGIVFNLNNFSQANYPAAGNPSFIGLFIDGGPLGQLIPSTDSNPMGINFYNYNLMACTIVYDGTYLVMVIRDTVTGAQARYTWPVDIPGCCGQNNAWAGFTAGQNETNATLTEVKTWTWWQGYNTRLATPTFSVPQGQYTSSQSVSISGPSGATIYYTTNGLSPTSASTQYTGPISITTSQVIQAVSIQSGYTDSYVAVANYQIASPGTPLINFPSGFATPNGLIQVVGRTAFSGSQIQLTDTLVDNEVGAAWYSVPVGIGTFTCNFTMQFTSASANGMCFVIQNQAPASSDTSIHFVTGGPFALGGYGPGLGYASPSGTNTDEAGPPSSVAVKFDVFSGNTTGLYTNGALPSTPQTTITGVTLSSGHPITCALTYSSTTLSLLLTDTVTSGTFSTSFTIDIPGTVGASAAYVGFTAATGGAHANQFVNAWTYSTP